MKYLLFIPFLLALTASTPSSLIVSSYDEINTYLDARLQAAALAREAYRQTTPTEQVRSDLIATLAVPPECLQHTPPEVLEDTQVGQVENVSIYAVTLRVCGRLFRYKGLLGRIDATPRSLILIIHGSAGSPSIAHCLNKPEDYHHCFAREVAQAGYTVFAPAVLTGPAGDANLNRQRNELQKRALTTGVNLLGIETGQMISALDYLLTRPDVSGAPGVYGISLGGMLAAFVGAVDTRLETVVVSGWFEDRQAKLTGYDDAIQPLWRIEQTDYNYLPGYLLRFDDVTLAGLIAPRRLIVEVGNLDPRYPAVLALWPRIEAPGVVLIVGNGGHETYPQTVGVLGE